MLYVILLGSRLLKFCRAVSIIMVLEFMRIRYSILICDFDMVHLSLWIRS